MTNNIMGISKKFVIDSCYLGNSKITYAWNPRSTRLVAVGSNQVIQMFSRSGALLQQIVPVTQGNIVSLQWNFQGSLLSVLTTSSISLWSSTPSKTLANADSSNSFSKEYQSLSAFATLFQRNAIPESYWYSVPLRPRDIIQSCLWATQTSHLALFTNKSKVCIFDTEKNVLYESKNYGGHNSSITSAGQSQSFYASTNSGRAVHERVISASWSATALLAVAFSDKALLIYNTQAQVVYDIGSSTIFKYPPLDIQFSSLTSPVNSKLNFSVDRNIRQGNDAILYLAMNIENKTISFAQVPGYPNGFNSPSWNHGDSFDMPIPPSYGKIKKYSWDEGLNKDRVIIAFESGLAASISVAYHELTNCSSSTLSQSSRGTSSLSSSLKQNAFFCRFVETNLIECAFNPKNHIMAALDGDSVKIIQMESKESLSEGIIVKDLERESGLDSITWSPDGQIITIYSSKKSCIISFSVFQPVASLKRMARTLVHRTTSNPLLQGGLLLLLGLGDLGHVSTMEERKGNDVDMMLQYEGSFDWTGMFMAFIGVIMLALLVTISGVFDGVVESIQEFVTGSQRWNVMPSL